MMPLVSAEGRNFHLPPGLSRRRPSRLHSEEARFSYLRLGGCGYGTSHEGHAISYKLRYYSSFSRFHHEGIITTNTPDRRATTLLYDINSPRYDGAGRTPSAPRKTRQHRALTANLRLSCRKAKVPALCNGQPHTHAAPHLHAHLTLHAPRTLKLLGVTGAPSANC